MRRLPAPAAAAVVEMVRPGWTRGKRREGGGEGRRLDREEAQWGGEKQ